MIRPGELRRLAMAVLLSALLGLPAVAQNMGQYIGLAGGAQKIQMPRLHMPNGTGGSTTNGSSPAGSTSAGSAPAGTASAGCGARGVTAPKLLSQVTPEYSDEARKDRVEGAVLLSVRVSAKGQPAEVHVVEGLGHGLDEKALEAVRQWKFEPGTKDGCPVSARVYVRAKFRLGD